MRITPKTPLSHIRKLLAFYGYDPSLAPAVKRACAASCLLWTRERLVTTDASRIDVRPQLPEAECTPDEFDWSPPLTINGCEPFGAKRRRR